MRSQRTKTSERWLSTMLCVAATFVVTSCATGYGADRGGYGQRYPGSPYVDLVGTVVGVERGYDRIVLEVRGDSYSEADDYYARGGQIEVRYNQSTTLIYQGRAFPVEGLERGDVIRIEGRRSGSRLVADSIEVLRNVREYHDDVYDDDYGNEYGNQYGYEESLRGTVRYVEPRDRVISLDVDYGERIWVRYDDRTVVEYNGGRYLPANLEPGDVVRIEAERHGGDWVAEVIHVQRDATRN